MVPSTTKRVVVTLKDLATSTTNGQGKDGNKTAVTPPPNNLGYCQPAVEKDGTNKIPSLYVIPNLPQSDVCESTLRRIRDEFLPIIQRRGYNVISISELCCCGDGVDYSPGKAGGGGRGSSRRGRKMGDNVLGYNRTTSFGRHGGGGNYYRKSSHTIHLRLRDPKDHTRKFYPWEDVAGTMAHELSHCVYQNHDDAFFKLMEEILEEHFNLQTYGHSSGPSFLRPVNGPVVQQQRNGSGGGLEDTNSTGPASMPFSTGGQKLGGRSGGRSRLLEPGFQGGCEPRRLGGGPTAIPSRLPLTQQELRQRVANAAEQRQRQLNNLRRTVDGQKAKQQQQSCVIEILDDDDEDDDAIAVGSGPPPVVATSAAAAMTTTTPPNHDDTDDDIVIVEPPSVATTTATTTTKPSWSSKAVDSGLPDTKPAAVIAAAPANKRKEAPNRSSSSSSIISIMDVDCDDDELLPVQPKRRPQQHRRRKKDNDMNAKGSASTIVDLTTTNLDDDVPKRNETKAVTMMMPNDNDHDVVVVDDSHRWQCHLCTFLNRFNGVMECEMCHTRKLT